MSGWPRSLFGRTAMLIAGTLLVFSLIAWQAMVWTVVVPAAQLTSQALARRATAGVAAYGVGGGLPSDTRFEDRPAPDVVWRFRGFAYGVYVETIRRDLQVSLRASEVRIGRLAAPTEFWLRLPELPGRWLVLSWRLGGPTAPLAALAVLAAGAFLVLGGAALSARRLTAPLARLAAAAARVAEGERVAIATTAGPSEVRSLAVAFQSMSHRLAELDDQRELMLGGISHDLRTPLARIRVALELLQPQDPALLAEMAASVEEMDRMIGQFLHYVRANYHELPSCASLDELIEDTLAIPGGDTRLRFELNARESRSFAVECARHTVLNLVQNAFEHGSPPVTVRSLQEEGGLLLSVSDGGAGLSDAEWAQAVRPFHRLHPQPGSGHAGLGLALVDRLVRRCGGTLIGIRHDDGFTVAALLPCGSPNGTDTVEEIL